MATDLDESTIICLSTNHKQIIVVDTEQRIDQIPKLNNMPLSVSDSSYTKFQSTILKKESGQNGIYVIVSILSGTQRAKPFFETILEPLLEELSLDGKYNVEYTKSANSIIDLT